MKQTRLILTGGFLGAGKTTLIWNVAQRLMAQGKRVGLITNDQAPELVDSRLLKSSDLNVQEVAGSCFCCNFNGFVSAIKNLPSDIEADIILAEPVGSCADLSATIVNPLKKFYNTELLVSPLTVLVDPIRLKSILYGGSGGLHEDAAYIFRKQMEESDVILVTKTDLLAPQEVERMLKDVKSAFPACKVMAVSTLKGEGITEWLDEVGSRIDAGTKLLDIDYDRYAHGEAVLGWLNGTVHLSGPETNWDVFFKVLMNNLAQQFAQESLPIGHVKVIAENGKQNTSANITGDASTLQFRGTAGSSEHLKLIVNARVETSPEHLDELVREALVNTIGDKFETEVTAWKFLQPGRPNPTHRFTQVV